MEILIVHLESFQNIIKKIKDFKNLKNRLLFFNHFYFIKIIFYNLKYLLKFFKLILLKIKSIL